MGMPSNLQLHYRACNLCEATCGLIIEHQKGEIISIKGDAKDPLSKGYLCPKAVALQDIYHDPDRLKRPIRKSADGEWLEISWEAAFDEVANRIKTIQQKYGQDSVAFYQGNPSVHNLGTMLFSRGFKKALNSKNQYSATSMDQLPHHLAAIRMFGHPLMIPIPDIDRTDFFLVIGANPLASNGSMMTAPGMSRRIKSLQDREGKMVVIDPRKSETAQKADEYLPVVPGTDVLLLLALIHELFRLELVDVSKSESYLKGVELLKEAVAEFSPAKVSSIVGISVRNIEQLAIEFSQAKSAVCYGRMGVSVQQYGTLCQWLINALNILSGNFDKAGGHMFTTPAVKVRKAGRPPGPPRWKSRVSGQAEVIGELPIAVLAEEITTPGPGQIKAFICSAGNPVLSSPNGTTLDTALNELEFMVSIDIYLNETSRHADIILPPATGLEVDHYDLIFNALAVRNTAKYSPALFNPTTDARSDWQIFKTLTKRLDTSKKSWLQKMSFNWQTPNRLLNLALKTGPYGKLRNNRFNPGGLTLSKLKKHPHGIDFGPLKSVMPKLLFTADKKIDLAPADFISEVEAVGNYFFNGHYLQKPLVLISRRHLRSNNSWMQGIERLAGGSNKCTLQMNPHDAQANKLTDNAVVKVNSNTGSIEVTLEVTDSMMPGVVSLPHGWSNTERGASINNLTNETKIDKLSGNAAFSGIEVQVSSA